MVPRPRRVLGYARVSGTEQGKHGTSLEAQRDEIQRFCRSQSFPDPVIRVEVESAGAEKLARRAELRALLDELRPGDMVVVAAVDRWSRDIVFAVQSVRELVARGIGWRALREGIDASTPHGDSHLGIMAWTADTERSRIRARTVGRRLELRDQGCWVEGPAPFGYSVEARRLVLVPKLAAHVRELFTRCGRGTSLAELSGWMRDRLPGRQWDRQVVHRMLRARWYLGQVRSSTGTWIEAHEAIVDRRTFDRAQEALRSRRLAGRAPASPRTEQWLLRGLASCALCGRRIGAAYSPGAQQGRATIEYYACNGRLSRTQLRGATPCTLPYRRVADVDPIAGAAALERLVELRDEIGRGPTPQAKPTSDWAARAERLERRRERVIENATDGTITREDLRRELARLDGERGKLERARDAEQRSRAAATPRARRALLRDLEALRAAWDEATVPVRRQILARLAARIVLGAEGAPVVQWRSAEDLLTPEV